VPRSRSNNKKKKYPVQDTNYFCQLDNYSNGNEFFAAKSIFKHLETRWTRSKKFLKSLFSIVWLQAKIWATCRGKRAKSGSCEGTQARNFALIAMANLVTNPDLGKANGSELGLLAATGIR
jgi:hypothetical protein